MMRGVHVVVGTLLVAVLVFAACGNDEAGGSNTPSQGGDEATGTPKVDPNEENDLAESLVLTLHDFPAGWAGTPPVDDEDDSFDERCGREGPAPGRTGVADSDDFTFDPFAEVSQSLALFEDEAAARASISEMDEFTRCVVELFNAGEFDADEVTFSEVTVERVSFPSFGDSSNAHRVKALISATDGSGFSADMYMDIVTVSVGRAAFMILAFDLLGPLDTSTLESVTERAVARIESANIGSR